MSRVVSATETEAISPNSSQMQDLDMSQVLKAHIIEERRNTAESMTEIMPSATKYDVWFLKESNKENDQQTSQSDSDFGA